MLRGGQQIVPANRPHGGRWLTMVLRI